MTYSHLRRTEKFLIKVTLDKSVEAMNKYIPSMNSFLLTQLIRYYYLIKAGTALSLLYSKYIPYP